MLFKSYLVEPILSGKKTETRRLWKRCRLSVGSRYKVRTGCSNESVFGTITVTYIRREKLGSIDTAGVRREGCRKLDEFKRIWTDSYGSWQPDAEVYVIGFRLVQPGRK
ncbi:MAG: ASCH domain-containing protein [Nitrososphaerales archaeon]